MDFSFRRRVLALHGECHARTLRLDQPVTTRAVLRDFSDSTCAMSSQAGGRAARRVDRSQLPTPNLTTEANYRDRTASLHLTDLARFLMVIALLWMPGLAGHPSATCEQSNAVPEDAGPRDKPCGMCYSQLQAEAGKRSPHGVTVQFGA